MDMHHHRVRAGGGAARGKRVFSEGVGGSAFLFGFCARATTRVQCGFQLSDK